MGVRNQLKFKVSDADWGKSSTLPTLGVCGKKANHPIRNVKLLRFSSISLAFQHTSLAFYNFSLAFHHTSFAFYNAGFSAGLLGSFSQTKRFT